MENDKHSVKTILILVAVLVLAGLIIYKQGNGAENEPVSENTAEAPVIEETPEIGGVLAPPEGFPSEIPLEDNIEIAESMTTHHPELGTLYSVSYESAEGQEEKILEYKEWLAVSGFEIREKEKEGVLKIYGERGDGKVFVSVHLLEEGSLVEVSWLEK